MSIKYKNSDILSVPNVSSLFTLKNLNDNQLVQTQGYSAEGVGANLYRYDVGSSATIDGGFVLPGPGGTLSFSGTTFNGDVGDGGRFIAVNQNVIDVTQFGALGNGSNDDTQALKLAITLGASTGTEVIIPGGVYITNSLGSSPYASISIRGIGNPTLKSKASATGEILFIDANSSIYGVTFDANNEVGVTYLLECGSASPASSDIAYISECVFKNMSSDTFATALLVTNTRTVFIEKCKFTSIKALANSVVGDSNGSVRAIYFSYDIYQGTVSKCVFDGVNNRTAGGLFAYEDADGIHLNPGGGTLQNVSIENCKFRDIGKRAIKMQSKLGCRLSVSTVDIESTYTGTSDNAGDSGNAMYAAISLLGGGLIATDIAVHGGACGYFVDVATTAVDKFELSNIDFAPEYHRYANTTECYGIYVNSTATALEKVYIENSRFIHCHNAMLFQPAIDAVIVGNIIDCQSNGIAFSAPLSVVVNANIISFENAATISGTPYGIYFGNGITAVSACSNIVNSLGDGIYLVSQSSSFNMVATGNAFNGLTRNILSNFGSETAPDLIFTNNVPNSTVIE